MKNIGNKVRSFLSDLKQKLFKKSGNNQETQTPDLPTSPEKNNTFSKLKASFNQSLEKVKESKLAATGKGVAKKAIDKITSEEFKAKAQQYLSDKQKAKLAASAKKFKSVDWYNIHNNLFNALNFSKFHSYFLVLTVVLMVSIIGKSLGLLLTGISDPKLLSSAPIQIEMESKLSKKDIDNIQRAQLFKTQAAPKAEGPGKVIIAENIKCTEGSKTSRLPIKLINTVVLQDSVKSIAAVQVRSSRELQEFREGDKIEGLAKIDKIDRLSLVIKNLKTGNCESIENQEALKQASVPIDVLSPSQSRRVKLQQKEIKGVKNEGNKYTIEQNLLEEKMKNIQDLLTQARGIPMNNPDGSMSFKIVDIQPGSLYSYLGIENEDIITHINGKRIKNINEVMNLFSKIKNIKELNLTLNRGGGEVTQEYNVNR